MLRFKVRAARRRLAGLERRADDAGGAGSQRSWLRPRGRTLSTWRRVFARGSCGSSRRCWVRRGARSPGGCLRRVFCISTGSTAAAWTARPACRHGSPGACRPGSAIAIRRTPALTRNLAATGRGLVMELPGDRAGRAASADLVARLQLLGVRVRIAWQPETTRNRWMRALPAGRDALRCCNIRTAWTGATLKLLPGTNVLPPQPRPARTAVRPVERLMRLRPDPESRTGRCVRPFQGQRSARLKVVASKGGTLTGALFLSEAISGHRSSRSWKASRPRARGSANQSQQTPSRA